MRKIGAQGETIMARRGSTIDVEITEGAIRVRSHECVLTRGPGARL